jgi:hypothetical protein
MYSPFELIFRTAVRIMNGLFLPTGILLLILHRSGLGLVFLVVWLICFLLVRRWNWESKIERMLDKQHDREVGKY